jgi:isocitrate lyase
MWSSFRGRSANWARMFSLTKRYVLLVIFVEWFMLSDVIQQWSGADYADNLIKTVTGGVSSTSAMGAGVTELQFSAKL